MSELAQVVATFFVMSTVFIAPHLTELEGRVASIVCLLLALVFWVIGILIEG